MATTAHTRPTQNKADKNPALKRGNRQSPVPNSEAIGNWYLLGRKRSFSNGVPLGALTTSQGRLHGHNSKQNGLCFVVLFFLMFLVFFFFLERWRDREGENTKLDD